MEVKGNFLYHEALEVWYVGQNSKPKVKGSNFYYSHFRLYSQMALIHLFDHK